MFGTPEMVERVTRMTLNARELLAAEATLRGMVALPICVVIGTLAAALLVTVARVMSRVAKAEAALVTKLTAAVLCVAVWSSVYIALQPSSYPVGSSFVVGPPVIMGVYMRSIFGLVCGAWIVLVLNSRHLVAAVNDGVYDDNDAVPVDGSICARFCCCLCVRRRHVKQTE